MGLYTPTLADEPLQIRLTHIFVEDQSKALEFYTETLGFVKKSDEPVGKFRWLTVVSSADMKGAELLLEPNDNPAAATFQKALFEQGIPSITFDVKDLDAKCDVSCRLACLE